MWDLISSSEDGSLSSFPSAVILNYLYTIDFRSGVVGARVDFALRSSEIFPDMNALFETGLKRRREEKRRDKERTGLLIKRKGRAGSLGCRA